MKTLRRRRCLHCNELFRPDPRTRDRQRYCSAPECRKASKAASQARWLFKPENRDYFKGAEQGDRVRRWRKKNPGYRKSPPLAKEVLQEECSTQPADSQQDKADLTEEVLQEEFWMQPVVLLGLISTLTGGVLQEEMAGKIRTFHTRGLSILGKGPGTQPQGTYEAQKTPTSRSSAPSAAAVQLGRSPPGP